MVKTVRIKDAEKLLPNYEDYPNISVTGSLRGMRDQYGMILKYYVRIGGYYYYLRSYPNIDEILQQMS